MCSSQIKTCFLHILLTGISPEKQSFDLILQLGNVNLYALQSVGLYHFSGLLEVS